MENSLTSSSQADIGEEMDKVEEGSEKWISVKPDRNRRPRHIELRDLSEHDFLDLIEAKNQDKRFYGWLNF